MQQAIAELKVNFTTTLQPSSNNALFFSQSYHRQLCTLIYISEHIVVQIVPTYTNNYTILYVSDSLLNGIIMENRAILQEG